MQNPILENRKSITSYTAVWIIVMLIHFLLLTISGKVTISFAFVESLITNLLFAIIGLGLWFPIFYSRSDNQKLINTFLNHLFACVVTVGIWVLLSYVMLVSLFQSNTGYVSYFRESIPWRSGIGVLFYGVVILVYYLIIYYRSFRENTIRESELKALVTESELNSLKSQINPHFLFNSLNSISSLTMIQPGKAQEMIIKLSEFLRYSISNKEEKLTTLLAEINNINRYLDIEKVRFGKRLTVKQVIDEPCLKLKLPGLILQPLVENAVKYGVYENTGESVLEMVCNCNSASLVIILRNEFDPDFLYKKGEGIGLQNIRSRLRLLYNRDDLLMIRQEGNIFEAKVIFPQQ
ncbi:MAG TPA: histidine kinase [Bacteroidales bacterium]|nr:histidine kinase [Bacteroidales bacterium]